jgi:type VI secretion system VgrG family protein
MLVLGLEIEGIASSRLAPFEIDGFEAISTLYRFEIACDDTNGGPLDDDLAGRNAILRIGIDNTTLREVRGLIESYDIITPAVEGHPVAYRFRLAPTLSLLQRARYSQIYGTQDPVAASEIVKLALSGALQRDARLQPPSGSEIAHKVNLRSDYPRLDHLAQYEETNFNFVSRITEHYGIFYFFQNEGDHDTVVFVDDNILAPTLSGGGGLSWQAWAAGAEDPFSDTVHRFDAHCDSLPSRFFLTDYNYQLPHVPLLVDTEVDPHGSGNWCEHGAHYLTPEEGQFLVRVRAEEMKCRRVRFDGQSKVPRLSAGYVFSLKDHPFKAWNRKYLALSVRHRARVPRPGVDYGQGSVEMGYWNEFTAIPVDVQFRPERRTPRPRVDGLLNGRVEGDGTNLPMLDNQGRYRVRIPFDLSNAPESKGSRWVRLATPFGGDGDGMHFPLFPGTEVVLGCVNGDPDRPMILGAVPNPRNKNVVTNENPLVNRITYRSGMGLEAFGGAVAARTGTNTAYGATDGGTLPAQNAFSGPVVQEPTRLLEADAFDASTTDGSNSMRLWASGSSPSASDTKGGPSTGYQWLRLGQAGAFTPPDSTAMQEGNNAASGFDLATSGVGRIWAADNLYMMRNGGVGAASGEPDRLISIDDTQVLVAHDQAITIGETSGSPGYPSSITINAHSVSINQDSYQSNVGQAGAIAITAGDTSAMVLGDSNGLYFGLYTSLYVGGYVAIYAGPLVLNINAGGLFTVTVGAGISISLSSIISIGTANTFELSAGGLVKVKSTDTLISEAKTEIIAAEDTKILNNTLLIANLQSKLSDLQQEVSDMDISVVNITNNIIDTRINILAVDITL